MKKMHIGSLLVLLTFFIFAGCSTSLSQKSEIKTDNKTMVILKDANTVKAQKRVATRFREFTTSRGLEWTDNKTFYTYEENLRFIWRFIRHLNLSQTDPEPFTVLISRL